MTEQNDPPALTIADLLTIATYGMPDDDAVGTLRRLASVAAPSHILDHEERLTPVAQYLLTQPDALQEKLIAAFCEESGTSEQELRKVMAGMK